MQTNETLPLYTIAQKIRADWKNVNYAARPYLEAMSSLSSVNDSYGFDNGRSIIRYFLCNAGTWRGPIAKEVKSLLKSML
jgi:hypothetical protein